MRELPFVTVIMPIRNEARVIADTLGRVLAQDYPADCMEILVVDGISDDGTRQIIWDLRQQHSNLYLLDNPAKIVPTALNIGLRQAKGEIILRVDGHTEIAPDYVRKCVEALQRTGADNVGGRMDATGENLFGEAVAIATSSPFGIGGSRFHFSEKEEWVDSVYMGAWPRRVFEKIGFFDEELVRDQDDEFNYRLRANGGRILLCPEIKSKYVARGTARSLWRQYFQYGFWKVRVLQKHPRQMSLRHFIPALFVLASLLSLAVWFLFPPIGIYLVVGIIGSYILANLSASVWSVFAKGARSTPYPLSLIPYFLLLLPLIFAILHVGYGTGFLVGLVKFANRWGDKAGKAPELYKEQEPISFRETG